MAKGIKYFEENVRRLHSYNGFSNTSPISEMRKNSMTTQPNWLKAKKYRDIYNGEVVAADFAEFMPPKTKDYVLNAIIHKDIVSPKVKVLVSMENQRPFEDVLMAVNREATTQREQKESELLRTATRNQIMLPLEQALAIEAQKAIQGRELSPEEMEAIKQQMAQQLEAMTPKEVPKYMLREYQTPADIAGNQVLEFLKKYRKLKYKFDEGLKDAAITRSEIYRLFENYGHPDIEQVMGENVKYAASSYSKFIQDADVVIVQYDWTYERICQEFKDMDPAKKAELRAKVKDNSTTVRWDGRYIPVFHYLWREIEQKKVVVTIGEDGGIVEDMVDSDYKHDPETEEVRPIDVEVIYEAWTIGEMNELDLVKYGEISEYYDYERPKMPYYGGVYDDWFMNRMIVYQMLYSVVWYRIEVLLGKNKGKKTAINAKTLAMAGSGVAFDIEKWMRYMDEDDFIFLDPSAEGNRNSSTGNMTDLIKEINMTNEGDISSMMKLLDYIDYKAGETVGIPKQLEGQIAEREGVQNVDKIFNTTLRLLEPYYQVHDQIKADVTAALVDFARAIYRKKQPTNLYYVLDDMSINWITHNTELFCMSQYGLFINNASNTLDALNKIGQITSLYAQNSSAKYSTLIKVSLIGSSAGVSSHTFS